MQIVEQRYGHEEGYLLLAQLAEEAQRVQRLYENAHAEQIAEIAGAIFNSSSEDEAVQAIPEETDDNDSMQIPVSLTMAAGDFKRSLS